jgi:hypothetical protein
MSRKADGSIEESLKGKLRVVEEEFDRQMRARGFDPAQNENVALTGSLMKLYLERERLRAAVEELNNSQESED